MKIREMFKKKIDRPIQGVVKVGQDDDERVKQELEEYVVTEELYKHISHFFFLPINRASAIRRIKSVSGLPGSSAQVNRTS
ncbi:hypothetical protein QS257_06445 [Terrilactibacillus sp. S3-3]|nr:hypothetical protein QS257_06445 [Terrilactibacillus sp. S3-3]